MLWHCTAIRPNCKLHSYAMLAVRASLQVWVGIVWQVELPADAAIMQLAGDKRWLSQARAARCLVCMLAGRLEKGRSRGTASLSGYTASVAT